MDDHQIVIDGLKAAFGNYQHIKIVGTTTSGADMLALMELQQVQVLLTDMVMPQMSGQELSTRCHELFPHIAIIALSMNGDASIINQLMKEEVIDGYLLKYCGIQELVIAIETVANGGTYFQQEVLEELEQYEKQKNVVLKTRITTREKQIIALMEKDYGNKQIASHLNISIRTVETHRKNIFRKTNTNNVLTLVKWAYENKML